MAKLWLVWWAQANHCMMCGVIAWIWLHEWIAPEFLAQFNLPKNPPKNYNRSAFDAIIVVKLLSKDAEIYQPILLVSMSNYNLWENHNRLMAFYITSIHMYNEIVRWGKHRLVHSVKGNSEARPILTDEQSFDVVHKLTLIWLLSCHHYHRMHNIFVGFCLRFDGFSHVKFPFVIKHNTILRKKKYLDISEKCVLFPTLLI